MKTMTTFAATLAVGMALAPMAATAANVPTIEFFGGSDQGIDYAGGEQALSGFFAIEGIIGLNTPSNANERRDCNRCNLSFSTGATEESGEYQ